jgi:uncharacterized metal-binding protein YceD (DUF177 family)
VADPPGAEIVIEANEAQRQTLAETYGLVGVGQFVAHATVKPGSGSSLTVEGRVEADIVQACVVTLEPVPQHIDEAFSLRFVRDHPRPQRAGEEIFVDVGEADPPEVVTGSTIDVGALAEEHFALAIDPYPRAPGAALPEEARDGEGAADSPFAGLAALAGKGGGKK